MRTFLVTGGAGFIGSHIATALVERGDRVRVLDNLSTGHRANLAHLGSRVELIEGDLIDAKMVQRAVEGVDCVFHEAALASVPRSVETPLDTNAACVTGTVTLLDAARRAGVRRLVYAGSSSAYGDLPSSPKHETDLPAPISPYGAAKLAAEYYCKAFTATYGFETVTLRYFNVFGPRQDPGSPYSAVIPLFITALLAGKRPTVYGDGQQSRDFTYVDNVVYGNLLAADAPEASGRVFNVANGRATSLLNLLRQLNSLLNTGIEPIHEAPRVGDIRESLADISAAQKWLGYQPRVSFEDGLRRSIDYYREWALSRRP
ncbi:MAG TPA: SDR family oxidoreductase [Pirellulales bacterium]|nr:SDR family oxidoreductase [Pirellulales bacterium]